MNPEPDMHAFELVYRAQSGRILLTLLRLTGSREDAEDLTHETFLRAWRSWSSFEGRSAPSTWLHTIAIRAFADWRRSNAKREHEHERAFVDQDYPQHVANFAPDADLDLEHAIACLPAKMRDVVVLHYIEGLALDDIAARLGKSVGTLKAQLHAARIRLREAIGGT